MCDIQTTILLLDDGRKFYGHSFGTEGRPNVVDGIKNDEINLAINTTLGPQSRYDEEAIGRACIQKSIMAITTLSGAEAAVRAIRLINQTIQLRSIQEYHH
ncbi:MAG: hypothetical protein NZ825_15880 [Candidatus Marinimicrobia bacterium]|nr:hypothetical protein [Candidatus Neomarinimicrobiota bacterium]